MPGYVFLVCLKPPGAPRDIFYCIKSHWHCRPPAWGWWVVWWKFTISEWVSFSHTASRFICKNAFVENIRRGRFMSVIKSYKISYRFVFLESQRNEILKKPTLKLSPTKSRAWHMNWQWEQKQERHIWASYIISPWPKTTWISFPLANIIFPSLVVGWILL